MTSDGHQPDDGVASGLTITAIAVAVVCCAAPLLIAAGIVTSLGVLLRNLALIVLGTALIAWPVWRTIRNRHRQTDQSRPHADDPSATDRI